MAPRIKKALMAGVAIAAAVVIGVLAMLPNLRADLEGIVTRVRACDFIMIEHEAIGVTYTSPTIAEGDVIGRIADMIARPSYITWVGVNTGVSYAQRYTIEARDRGRTIAVMHFYPPRNLVIAYENHDNFNYALIFSSHDLSDFCQSLNWKEVGTDDSRPQTGRPD